MIQSDVCGVFVMLAISALAVVGGILGFFRPEIYRSSMENSYNPRSARIGSAVLLAMGLAGLYAILVLGDAAGDFFPV